MKQTLDTERAADILRQDQYAGWSYDGARAMVEALEMYEDDSGEEMEFDAVAIRCDFSEFGSAREAVIGIYAKEEAERLFAECEDAGEKEEAALDFLRDDILECEFDGGVIVRNQ